MGKEWHTDASAQGGSDHPYRGHCFGECNLAKTVASAIEEAKR